MTIGSRSFSNTSRKSNGTLFPQETSYSILCLMGISIYISAIFWRKYFLRLCVFYNNTISRAKLLGFFGTIGKLFSSVIVHIRDNYPPYVFYILVFIIILLPILLAYLMNREELERVYTTDAANKKKASKKND